MNNLQHLLDTADMTAESIFALFELANNLKADPEKFSNVLAGKSIVTLYEKPSLRTRVTFDIGINKLGGHAVYLDHKDDPIGQREAIQDYAKNLSQWADCIVGRVFFHETLEEIAKYSSVPVINSLCDRYHPCQALADFLTLYEHHDDVSKLKIAYLGDGNNVCHSLMLTGAVLGATVTAVTPISHSPNAIIVKQAQDIAANTGATIQITSNINDVEGYDVIYTDTWISMGAQKALEHVLPSFLPYQVNKTLMKQVGAQHVLHCQPAHRGQEITSDVMDSDQSLILPQAENRMHIQNAILVSLLA